jgi:hypothetical protein
MTKKQSQLMRVLKERGKERGWEVNIKRSGKGSHTILEITTTEGITTTISITNRPPPIETIEKEIMDNIEREDRLRKERDENYQIDRVESEINEVEDKKEIEMARPKTPPVSMNEVETLTLKMDRMKEEFRNLYQYLNDLELMLEYEMWKIERTN